MPQTLQLSVGPHIPPNYDTLLSNFWTALVQDGRVRSTDLGEGFTAHSQASLDPCFAAEIMDHHLYSDTGLFQTLVPRHDLPRISALLTRDSVPVAHALLHPIDAHPGSADPHHALALVGFSGVYVRPDLRRQGLARRVATVLGAHMAPHVSPEVACVAETRVLPLFTDTLPCPVVPRYSHHRADSPEVILARDTPPVFEKALQARTWARWLKAGDVVDHGHGVLSQIHAAPLWADAIEAAGLEDSFGEMPHRLRAATCPRISAVAFEGGSLVAHALLMPTAAYGCGGSEVSAWMGAKLGLIDGRHAPGHPEALQACLQAIGARVGTPPGRIPVCLTAEAPLVGAARAACALRVVARWRSDRRAGEYQH